jgi:hypothetical protein
MAAITGDTDIEAKLPRLSQKPYPDRISIGAEPEPAEEEGEEDEGGRSQFEVIPGIQVFGTLAGGKRRKTTRRRR